MLKVSNEIRLSNFVISNSKPFILIGGLNVIESRALALETSAHFKEVCHRLNVPLVFKASFDKANRSTLDSFRGPGIEIGLEILDEIKRTLQIPIVTDVHTSEQAKIVSNVCDVIQLPAFLARQTDLIKSIASTQCIINIKKSQFLSPSQMVHVLNKFIEFGNNKLLICERGTSFGYDNLVVDMLGIEVMKNQCDDVPIIFDVSHSLQCRDAGAATSGGRRSQLIGLARAAISMGISGLFLETHPNPSQALCDGPCALPLRYLEDLIDQLKQLDSLTKSFPRISITD